jgi:hypothetical protein
MSPPHPVILLVARRQLVPVVARPEPRWNDRAAAGNGANLRTLLGDHVSRCRMRQPSQRHDSSSGQRRQCPARRSDQAITFLRRKIETHARRPSVRRERAYLLLGLRGRGGSPWANPSQPPAPPNGRPHRHEAPRFGGPEGVRALGDKAAAEHTVCREVHRSHLTSLASNHRMRERLSPSQRRTTLAPGSAMPASLRPVRAWCRRPQLGRVSLVSVGGLMNQAVS